MHPHSSTLGNSASGQQKYPPSVIPKHDPTKTVKDELLACIAQHGPSLPKDLATLLSKKIDTLLVSAYLADLVSMKRLLLTHLKIGGSPLYYLPEQAPMLAQIASTKLKGPELEAFTLLQEKKLLDETTLAPKHRVALGQLKDFAKRIEILYQGKPYYFWRWYLLSADELKLQVSALLSKITLSKESKETIGSSEQEHGTPALPYASPLPQTPSPQERLVQQSLQPASSIQHTQLAQQHPAQMQPAQQQPSQELKHESTPTHHLQSSKAMHTQTAVAQGQHAGAQRSSALAASSYSGGSVGSDPPLPFSMAQSAGLKKRQTKKQGAAAAAGQQGNVLQDALSSSTAIQHAQQPLPQHPSGNALVSLSPGMLRFSPVLPSATEIPLFSKLKKRGITPLQYAIANKKKELLVLVSFPSPFGVIEGLVFAKPKKITDTDLTEAIAANPERKLLAVLCKDAGKKTQETAARLGITLLYEKDFA